MSVTNKHGVYTMDSWRVAGGHGGSTACGLWFDLRRRTTDGYTRIEFTTSSEVKMVNSFGDCKFTVYVTDDELRAMAAALLDGIAEPAN